jgi:hypothetical protein
MHEAAFANAALPRKVVVLKLPLKPYCIAHELWLISRNNPFVCGGIIERRHVEQAVLVCHHSHEEIQRMDSDWLLSLKISIWSRRIRKENTALAVADFKNYLAANTTHPKTEEIPSDKTTRAPGAPFIQRLLHFLMFKMKMTESAAMNYPYGLAVWHYSAVAESEEAIMIPNATEIETGSLIESAIEFEKQGLSPGEALKMAQAKGGK